MPVISFANLQGGAGGIEAFCWVADANGRGLVEPLEHAAALLEKEHLRQG